MGNLLLRKDIYAAISWLINIWFYIGNRVGQSTLERNLIVVTLQRCKLVHGYIGSRGCKLLVVLLISFSCFCPVSFVFVGVAKY